MRAFVEDARVSVLSEGDGDIYSFSVKLGSAAWTIWALQAIKRPWDETLRAGIAAASPGATRVVATPICAAEQKQPWNNASRIHLKPRSKNFYKPVAGTQPCDAYLGSNHLR